MAHVRDDASVSNNSVFDWGISGGKNSDSRSVASGGAGDASTNAKEVGPSSRYDPKAMSRIVDINDLVDDSGDDSEDDDAIIGHSTIAGGITASGTMDVNNKRNRRASGERSKGGILGYGPGGIGSALMCRQILIIMALVAIIVGASMAIGYAVINGDPNAAQSQNNNLSGSNNRQQQQGQQQNLLEIAERVILACSESSLDEDMSECQSLCKKNMCCFAESGEYSCEDDEEKDCAVYAGCANLLEGVPLDAAEEDEE